MGFKELERFNVESISADVSSYICHLSFGFPGGISSPPVQEGVFSANLGVAVFPQGT
jgi:hypothetical protein